MYRGSIFLTSVFAVIVSAGTARASGAFYAFYVQVPGTLSQVSADVGDLGTAACWILLDKLTGKYAYVSNNPSNTISSYTVKADGTVTLLDAVAAPVRGPNDLAGAVENGASFMYVVNAGKKTIEAFQINSDGSLNFLVPLDISTGVSCGFRPPGHRGVLRAGFGRLGKKGNALVGNVPLLPCILQHAFPINASVRQFECSGAHDGPSSMYMTMGSLRAGIRPGDALIAVTGFASIV